MFTRRVLRRENRLRASRKVNEIVGYLLAVLSSERGIELNAICYLGDHEHGVANDPDATLSELLRDLHALIANHINAVFDEDGALWDSRQTHVALLAEPEDILRKMAYVATNPVKHGLVKFARSYPGLRMIWPCKPKTFKLPTGYLDAGLKRPDGSPRWPETATLEMHRPRGFEHLSERELAVRLAEIVKSTEEEFRAEVIESGRQFVGRRALSKVPREYRAKTKEPRRGIVPRIVCGRKEIRKSVLEELADWLSRYRVALKEWVAGNHDVEFPHGTYKMRVLYRARIAPT